MEDRVVELQKIAEEAMKGLEEAAKITTEGLEGKSCLEGKIKELEEKGNAHLERIEALEQSESLLKDKNAKTQEKLDAVLGEKEQLDSKMKDLESEHLDLRARTERQTLRLQ